MRTALDALPDREREVIERRYGLSGQKARTLEEVGRAFGVTRERIRQIENNTLKKLEGLPEAQGLRDDFLDYGAVAELRLKRDDVDKKRYVLDGVGELQLGKWYERGATATDTGGRTWELEDEHVEPLGGGA